MAGKETRRPFQTNMKMRAKECLVVVYSEVCGPFEVPSLGGNKYFITFVDEYSRMIWMYVIKMKSAAFEFFLRFKANVERESGKLLKTLRTDGGGEFTSNAFENNCQANGIMHEVTTLYTPQHNALAETRNKTILNMVRNLLKEKGLPHKLWGETASMVVYILNRCPTKVLEAVVPLKVWSGVKPAVEHFRVFGSLAFKHIPDQRRTKLQDKSTTMVFIGYHPTGAYKLFDPNQEKVVLSIYVLVLEDQSWDWENKQTSLKKCTLDSATLTEFEKVGSRIETAPETVTIRNMTRAQDVVTQKPQREIVVPHRFADFEMVADELVDDDGDLVYISLMARAEPIDEKEVVTQPIWRDAMHEELK